MPVTSNTAVELRSFADHSALTRLSGHDNTPAREATTQRISLCVHSSRESVMLLPFGTYIIVHNEEYVDYLYTMGSSVKYSTHCGKILLPTTNNGGIYSLSGPSPSPSR